MSVKQEINIVFASDNNYIQHATVAMQSIRDNTSLTNRLHFYVLSDDIEEDNKAKVQATFSKKNAAVDFIEMDAQLLEDFFVSGQLSRAAYLRLQMAEVLPNRVNKAIYLDCDLLVEKDIEELWRYDMKGRPLAAVPDYGIMASHKDWPRKQQRLNFQPTDLYFNSGVLVIDLMAWRTKGYGKTMLELARNADYQHHDQDVLNKVFYGKWIPLPLNWNVIPPVWNLFLKILFKPSLRKEALQARQNIAILHYAGGYKPWEYREIPAFNAKYYRYLQETAFRDAVMPQLDRRRKGRSIERQLWRLRVAEFWQWLLS